MVPRRQAPLKATDLDAWRRRIVTRQVRVGVIGLGYVGLPLAVAFAQAGVRTTGVDVSPERVAALTRGESYILDVPPGEVRRLTQEGGLTATTASAALAEVDAVFICVPTPFTRAKAPDLSYILAATTELSRVLRPGQVVVLQSTTYPGTTTEVVLPILEGRGLKAGEDFTLAFSPERIDPGNRVYGAQNTPKVVGGLTPDDSERVATLFELILDRKQIHIVSGPRTAEMCKLLENTFRSVNIALVNELTKLCDRMGIDIWEVIDAAATKPFGFLPFYPGPGVGGHCIPVDPYYLSWKAREYDFYTKFIELAAEVNQSMPYYTVSKIVRALNREGRALSGATVLVLGVAFKRDIDDPRNAPSLEVMRILDSYQARVRYHDPHVAHVTLRCKETSHGEPRTYTSESLTAKLLREADCVLIAVHHTVFDIPWIVEHSRLIVDAQNATKGLAVGQDKIMKL